MVIRDDNDELIKVPIEEKKSRKPFLVWDSLKPQDRIACPLYFSNTIGTLLRWRRLVRCNFSSQTSICSSTIKKVYMLKQLNHSFIILIPKVEGIAKVEGYKLISLCKWAKKISLKWYPLKGVFLWGRVRQDNNINKSVWDNLGHEKNEMKASIYDSKNLTWKMPMVKCNEVSFWRQSGFLMNGLIW